MENKKEKKTIKNLEISLHDIANVVEFKIGEIVYLKTDLNQFPRLITGVIIRPNSLIGYELAFGEHIVTCWQIELQREQIFIEEFKEDD